MKKKPFRIIAILAIVAVFLGIALSRLHIEPADSNPPPQMGELLDNTPESEQPSQTENEGPSATPAQPEQPTQTEETHEKEQPEKEEAPSNQPDESKKPAAEPLPTESATPKTHRCSLEIRCDTVVDTSKLENEAVIPYVPANGVILATTETTYTPGESVFDVLKRVTREQGIQMEFREDALYSGAYIEGINYLYEFDGGSLSGWMYKVNGQFPNYGCSQYSVEDGDEIVWMYTCDLGRDVGDNSTW